MKKEKKKKKTTPSKNSVHIYGGKTNSISSTKYQTFIYQPILKFRQFPTFNEHSLVTQTTLEFCHISGNCYKRGLRVCNSIGAVSEADFYSFLFMTKNVAPIMNVRILKKTHILTA